MSTMEIELKLLIDPDQTDAFRNLPLLQQYAIGESRDKQMEATYFDTPELHIRRADAGLRVRRSDDEWIQTMKSGGSADGGLHQRNEWELPVSSQNPDLQALAALMPEDAPLVSLLTTPGFSARLVPIFTTQMTRRVWNLALPDGTQIECVLDQGALQRDGKSETISEVELELKSGSPEALIALALELCAALPFRIGHRSKAERGYALFAPPPKRVAKAQPVELSRRLTVTQALAIVLRNCMQQIQANEQEVATARSPENLHQMRVGFRRLRAALQAFSGAVPAPDDWLEELRWIAGQLGAARDADVLAEVTLPSIAPVATGEADWPILQKVAEEHAIAEYRTAADAIQSSRYTTLVLRFHAWLLELELRDREDGGMEIGRYAEKSLKKAHKSLTKRAGSLASRDAARAHRVRIAAKKLRYTMEIFASLYSAGSTRKYVKALTGLQETLGRMNDAAVAAGLLRKLEARDGRTAFASAFVRGFLAAQAQAGWQDVEQCWKRFDRRKRPFGA